MIFMTQNLASNPKMACKTITEAVMIIAFLYLMANCFTKVFRHKRLH